MLSTRQSTICTLLLVGMLILAGSAPAVVAQDSSSDPLDEWFAKNSDADEQEDQGLIDQLRSAVPSGAADALAILDGQMARVVPRPFEDVPTNNETADAFEVVVEENNGTFERKINAEMNVTSDYDTHGIIIAHKDSPPEAVYVVGNASNGNITNLRVLTESEFNATGRTVDEIWAVDGDAAKNLPELVGKIASRIATGQSVDRSYQARLGGRYCSFQSPISGNVANLEECDVRSTIWLTEQQVLNGGT